MRQQIIATMALACGLGLVALLPLRAAHAAGGPAPLPSEAARPGAGSGPTQVSLGVWVGDISKIDSAAQNFSANLGFVMRWKDPALAHNQAGVLRYNLKDIWHPNWLIANAASPPNLSLPEIVEVAADGMVTYRQRLIGTFAQSLDLRTFPFDHAIFHIHFIALGQKPAEIQFAPDPVFVAAGARDAVGVAKDITLQDWRVSNPAARSLAYQMVPGFEFAGYALEFRADRLVQHYIIKVILPLLLIVLMSWSAFWLDSKLGASQLSVAVTSMLTLIAYRFSVGADVPKLPYLTHLDAFILISSVLVLFTLIEVIITTALVSNDEHARAAKIDWHCRWIFPLAYAVVIVATLIVDVHFF
jgi:hypothetical protein